MLMDGATTNAISLPSLALAAGVTPDKLRVLLRRCEPLAALFKVAGATRFILAADQPRALELIAVANTPHTPHRIAASASK
jgi:hypothetical protein